MNSQKMVLKDNPDLSQNFSQTQTMTKRLSSSPRLQGMLLITFSFASVERTNGKVMGLSKF